jgi:hypothetical protein
MFHEWEGTDRGWAWKMGPDIRDPSGTWAFADRTLNMLVIIATHDPGLHGYTADMASDHARLLAKTPYATPVQPMPDTSYIVVFPSKAELRVPLAPGAAKRFYERLAYAELEDGELLSRLLELYEGGGRAELEQFVNAHASFAVGEVHSRAGSSSTSQPCRP